MKQLLLAVPLLLVACGARAGDVTVTVSGVTMGDLEKVRAQLAGLEGVEAVRAGQFKGDQAVFTLVYRGKGSDLAAALKRLDSGLRNVNESDEGAVLVAFAPRTAAPKGPPPQAATELPPSFPAPAPAPAPPPETPKVEKDPLAYKIHQLGAGTVATFDGWKIAPLPADANWTMFASHPEGKEMEFRLIVGAGTPEARIMADLFETGAQYLQQMIPPMRPVGPPQQTAFGGDEARVQDWSLENEGKKFRLQSVIIRKKDVAVVVLGIGTDAGWNAYSRSIAITAQSVTIKEASQDPALVGTWVLDSYYKSGTGTTTQFSHSTSTTMTIYPNGTFTESSFSASNLTNTTGDTSAYVEGGDRGRVGARGNILTFHYDNGKVWSAAYKVDGGGQAIVLNGKYWFRQ